MRHHSSESAKVGTLVKTSRWVVAIGMAAVVAGGALVYANQDDPSDDSPREIDDELTAGLPDDLADVVGVLGCDRLDEGVGYQFEGRAQSYDCSVDGDDIAVLHSYTPDRVADVERYLSARIDREQLNPCPDGSRPPGPWILVAPTWAASSFDEARIRLVADQLGGEFVGGGATPDDPPIGPPASYPVPGYCDQD